MDDHRWWGRTSGACGRPLVGSAFVFVALAKLTFVAPLIAGLFAVGASSEWRATGFVEAASAQQDFGPPAPTVRAPHVLDVPLLANSERFERDVSVRAASAREALARFDERRQLVLRYGSPVPPGLAATRTKDRRAQRDEGLITLVEQLGEQLPATLDALLADPSTDEDLWFAAAAAAGDVELTRLAPRLAECFAKAEPGSRRVAAAQRALYAMYGVWLTSAAEVEALAGLVEGPSLAAYREHVRALEEQLVTQLPRMWAIEQEAALAALSDRSPRVRSAAARALAAAAGAGRVDPTALVDALLERCPLEGDTSVLAALLESIAPSVQGRTPTDERVVALRAHLSAGVRSGPRAIQHVLSRTLALLPFESSAANVPESAASGLRLVVLALERVTEGELLDSDVAIGVLASLRSLAGAHRARELDLGGTLSEPVLALLESEAASRDVRIAAAGALADVGRAVDGLRAARRLGTITDQAEVGALLAALEILFSEPDTSAVLEGGARAALVAALAPHTASSEADVRRRALALLTAHAAAPGESADVGFLVPRLAAEPVVELRAQVLELLRRHGGPAEFDAMLAHGALGSVATTLPDGPRLVAELAAALPASDVTRRFGAARVLAELRDETLAVASLARAVELGVSSLEAAGIRATAEERAEVVAWTLALRERCGPLTRENVAATAPAAPPVLARSVVERLLTDVLPLAALPAHTARRALAVLSADARRPVAEVDAAFRAAEQAHAADATSAPQERFVVLFEHVRWLAAIDALDAARERARLLIASGAEATRWLGVAGLRDVLELFRITEPVDTALAAERASILLLLVELETWRALDHAVRLDDAIDLCRAAQASKDLALQRRAVLARPVFGLPTSGDDPAWADHEDGAERFGTLLDLYAAIDAYVAAREGEETSDDAPVPKDGSRRVPEVQGPPQGGR